MRDGYMRYGKLRFSTVEKGRSHPRLADIYLGHYWNPEKAAQAYDIACIKLRGVFGARHWLNFPVDGYILSGKVDEIMVRARAQASRHPFTIPSANEALHLIFAAGDGHEGLSGLHARPVRHGASADHGEGRAC